MLVLLFLASHRGWAAAPFMTETSVYRADDGGYFIHLNPALITTKKGSLLAFCEARVGSYADSAPIDIVLRRSFNGGNSWTPAVVVAHMQNYTVANAAPVEDRKTGVIWLLLTASPAGETQNEIVGGSSKGIRTVWITHSSDDGASWTPVQEITSSTKAQGWTWYATGPGNGIQLKNGRLLIPCDHRIAGSPAPYAHVIYSDDDGRTWKIGGSAGAETNESAVVQLADGSLLLNMRSFAGKNRRAISYSHDGGITWSPVTLDPALIEPVCQASLIRFTPMRKWRRTRLLFSNPADTVRDRMTVRLSYDEGKTWPVARLIYEGSSGYSSLAVLPDGTIGLLYDRGPGKPDPDGHWHPPDNSEISFAHFNLEWLTHGADHLTAKAK